MHAHAHETEFVAGRAQSGERSQARDAWGDVQVRVLPKQAAPSAFMLLRPITILQTSAAILPKMLQLKSSAHHFDEGTRGALPCVG